MNMNLMQTQEEIGNCFEAFSELRPHLKDKDSFTSQIKVQQKEGYALAAIFDEGKAAACVGFRVMTTLAWGKVL